MKLMTIGEYKMDTSIVAQLKKKKIAGGDFTYNQLTFYYLGNLIESKCRIPMYETHSLTEYESCYKV